MLRLPEVDLERAGRIIVCIIHHLGSLQYFSRGAAKCCWGRKSMLPCFTCCHSNPTLLKWINLIYMVSDNYLVLVLIEF